MWSTPVSRHCAPKKLAIVGLGHVSGPQLAAIAQLRFWQLVAVADSDGRKRSACPGDTPFFLRVEEMLDQISADLVVVATPTPTHYSIGIEVLSRGFNLLIEKPCCSTISEFDSLVQAAKESRRLFHVAFHSTFARDLAWYLRQSRIRAWGNPTTILCRFLDPYVASDGSIPNAPSLVSAWMDSGVNALAVIGRLLGDADVQVSRAEFVHHKETGDVVQAEVQLDAASVHGPTRLKIETDWLRGINSKSTLMSFDQYDTQVLLDHSDESASCYQGGRLVRRVSLRNNRSRLQNHYIGVFQDAFEALERGKSNAAFARSIHKLLFDAQSIALRGCV